jgi:hypothetical protein
VQLRASIRYEADIVRVAAMLADSEFIAAKVRAAGALSHSVAVVGDPEHAFTVTTRRHVPTAGIPPQVSALVGASLEIRQVEAWEAPSSTSLERRGTIVVEIVGAPVRLTGTLRLVADAASDPGAGGGTTGHMEGDLRASVPLFGAALEEATARAVHDVLDAEERAAAAWLAG